MKNYGNIGILDIRNAKKENLKDIKIGNVGIIIQSPDNPSLAGEISAGNIGKVIEIPPEGKVLKGDQVIDSSFLEGFEEPVYLLVLGKVRFTEDVTPPLLEKAISGLNVLYYGAVKGGPGIICEESLAPVLKKKIKETPTSIQTFSRGTLIWEGPVNFNSSSLDHLEENTSLMIIGSVIFSEDLDPDALLEKTSKIQVTGKVTTPEELITPLKKIISQPSIEKWEIIPAGFRLISEDLKLNQSSLENYQKENLYIKGSLQLGKEISPEQFKASIARLQVNGDIIAPEQLKTSIVSLTGDKKNLLTYPHGLYLVEGEEEMYPEDFEFLPEIFTLIVKGILKLDPRVEASDLHSRVDYLDNFGIISGTPAQIAALRARKRTDTGLLQKTGEKANDEKTTEEGTTTGNIGYLKL